MYSLSGMYQNRTGLDFTMIFRTGTDLSDRTGFSSQTGPVQKGPDFILDRAGPERISFTIGPQQNFSTFPTF